MHFHKLPRRCGRRALLASLAVILGAGSVVGLGARAIVKSPVMKHRLDVDRAARTGSEFWMFARRSDLETISSILDERVQDLSEEARGVLAEVILSESRRHELDPALVLAIIETESSFCNWVRSDRNAMGLMQILPATGEEVAREINIEWEGEASLYLPVVNVRVGTYYFKELVEKFDSVELALAAYNRGPGAVKRMLGRGRTPSQRYSRKVLSSYHEMRSRFAPQTS